MTEIRHSPFWKQRQTSETQRPDDAILASVQTAIEAAGFEVVVLDDMGGTGPQIRRVGRRVQAIVRKSSKRITWSPQYGEQEQTEFTWFRYVDFAWDASSQQVAESLNAWWQEDTNGTAYDKT